MAKEHLSVRLSPKDRRLMEEQAAGGSVSEIARRYMSQGLRRDRHPRVTFVPWRGDRPVLLRYPRLQVADVVETWKLSDRDERATVEFFGLPVEDIRAAIAYYREFPDEIDAILEEKYRIADRYEKLYRRERQGG